MVNELKLAGNELLAYAVIYGFSKDGITEYKGCSKYLAEVLNVSKNTAINALNSLTKKQLIVKKTEEISGIVFNRYSANTGLLPYTKNWSEVYQKLVAPPPKIATSNNIGNNIGNIKEIDISTLRSDISSKKNQENGRLSSQEIVDLYNSICTSMPKCIKLNEARLSAISAIRKEFSDSQIEDAFRKAEASDFLTLRSGRDWTGANFDWLMTKKHMLRVLEGIYNRTIAKPNNNNDIFGPNRKIRM